MTARGDETIELYAKVAVPLSKLAELHPDAVYSWGDREPDVREIIKAEKKALKNGERTVQDFLDLAAETRKEQLEASRNGTAEYPMPRAEAHYAFSQSYYFLGGEVRQTLQRYAPYLSSHVIAKLADAVLECLGYDTDGDKLAPQLDGPRGPNAAITRAVEKVAKFAPEFYSGDFAKLMAGYDSSFTDEEDASNFLNDMRAWEAERNGKPVDETVPRKSDPTKTITRRLVATESAPFFSEAVLYPLLGKDSARTLLALLRQVKSLAEGVDDGF